MAYKDDQVGSNIHFHDKNANFSSVLLSKTTSRLHPGFDTCSIGTTPTTRLSSGLTYAKFLHIAYEDKSFFILSASIYLNVSTEYFPFVKKERNKRYL